MIRIKQMRATIGMNQQRLADIIGVSRSTIAMWETGSSQPDNDSLRKLARALNCSIDFLLENDIITTKSKNEIQSSIYSKEQIIYTDAERKLITAYRAHPEMHEAVHRILGIEEAVPGFRLIAYGGDNVDNDTPTEPRIT